MIDKVLIQGYRTYREVEFIPNEKMNILVGDNESGKSTILEAISIAISGRIDGRYLQEELNPYWFNKEIVAEFFAARELDPTTPLPIINIEVYFKDSPELTRIHGAHNSEQPTRACPGVRLQIKPNPDYEEAINNYLLQETKLLPVDFYKVEWKSFADDTLTSRPKGVQLAIIDSKTIRSNSGIDYNLRSMLSDNLDDADKAAASSAYRMVKEQMNPSLADVNAKMELLEGGLNNENLSLAMDQSSKTSWSTVVSTHIGDLPFYLSGHGQQAAVKTSLAMNRHSTNARVVLIEEPENHLSHTSLNILIERISNLSTTTQQLFITTHSSFVLNRLGFDSLHFISYNNAHKLTGVEPDTVKYFQKLPGYDTLRVVLAKKIALVEGPSDEIIFERLYKDVYGKRPIEDGIDVISMRGLSLARCLELSKLLNKKCAAIRDIDDNDPTEIINELNDLIEAGTRELFISDATTGKTLEPQIISANSEQTIRTILAITPRANLLTWMTNNKTESALRIAEHETQITPPAYLSAAIAFIHDA